MELFATTAERDAERVLRGLGFATRKVQQTSFNTPDFEVEGDAPAYLVEVKSREWPWKILSSPEYLGRGIERSMTRDEKVGDWLAKSRKQFRTVDPTHDRLWFLWCSMESAGPAVQAERVMRTLYGVRDAYDAFDPTRKWTVFNSQLTAFERFPDIDGAVIVVPPDGVAFCPNEFSPRIGTVLACKLVTEFRTMGVPVHPHAIDATSSYVVPRTIDRSDELNALRHCQEALREPHLQFLALDVEWLSAFRAYR
jgi:hypothetical protein